MITYLANLGHALLGLAKLAGHITVFMAYALSDGQPWRAIALAALAPVCAAVTILIMRPQLRDSLALAAGAMLIAGAFLVAAIPPAVTA